MLEHINSLSAEEKNLIIHAPVYVSLLIAGADGDISSEEKNRMLELIHTKTFSERFELRELYKSLDADAANDMRKIIAALPEVTAERNEYLSDMIARLNKIFGKVEHNFAVQLYNSLREFAAYIANADGGWWGVGATSDVERAFVKLPMLTDPSNQD